MLNKTLNSEGVTSPQFTYLIFAFPISFYITIFPCFGILIVPGVRPIFPEETFVYFSFLMCLFVGILIVILR